ncbi:hypothetical protein Droror1_Dr00018723, partial [Drosera rotundifolia]
MNLYLDGWSLNGFMLSACSKVGDFEGNVDGGSCPVLRCWRMVAGWFEALSFWCPVRSGLLLVVLWSLELHGVLGSVAMGGGGGGGGVFDSSWFE